LDEFLIENESKERLRKALIPPPCSIISFTYESEESLNEAVFPLKEKERHLREELTHLIKEERLQQWESEILDNKCDALLKDKGVFYMRFCELWRTMKTVHRVTKSQVASDFASDLKQVEIDHSESDQDAHACGNRDHW
jgi:hypothetical protein